MTPFVLIPVKSLHNAKSRLSKILSQRERERIALKLFRGVLDATLRVVEPEKIVIVTDDSEILSLAQQRCTQHYKCTRTLGLNAALRAAIPSSAQAVLVLHADLPLLKSDDIVSMIQVGEGNRVVIAPDRHAVGTNALFLKPPDLIKFSFGEKSFTTHESLAKSAGTRSKVIVRTGLSFDLDTADDFRDLKQITNF
jgi:2-phospho-L-lactate guanylyltransferase